MRRGDASDMDDDNHGRHPDLDLDRRMQPPPPMMMGTGHGLPFTLAGEDANRQGTPMRPSTARSAPSTCTRRSGRGSIRWLARRSPSCLLSLSPAPKRAAVHRVCPQAQGGAPGPGDDAAAAATVDQLAETAKLAEAGDAFDAREILAMLNHRLPGLRPARHCFARPSISRRLCT
jgi:hypothetical protein